MKTKWNKYPETIPPGAEDHWFSPEVWIALKDGSVYMGQCLHKCKNATYDAPVHDWFIEGSQHAEDDIIAWAEIVVPEYS